MTFKLCSTQLIDLYFSAVAAFVITTNELTSTMGCSCIFGGRTVRRDRLDVRVRVVKAILGLG